MSDDVAAVIITRDRCDELLVTLEHLTRCGEAREILVVDNGSSDATCEQVARQFPRVRLIRAGRNLGGAGRNLGVAATHCSLVVFCDDDTRWTPGSIDRGAGYLRSCPSLAAVVARVEIAGTERRVSRVDPCSMVMAASPIPPSWSARAPTDRVHGGRDDDPPHRVQRGRWLPPTLRGRRGGRARRDRPHRSGVGHLLRRRVGRAPPPVVGSRSARAPTIAGPEPGPRPGPSTGRHHVGSWPHDGVAGGAEPTAIAGTPASACWRCSPTSGGSAVSAGASARGLRD